MRESVPDGAASWRGRSAASPESRDSGSSRSAPARADQILARRAFKGVCRCAHTSRQPAAWWGGPDAGGLSLPRSCRQAVSSSPSFLPRRTLDAIVAITRRGGDRCRPRSSNDTVVLPPHTIGWSGRPWSLLDIPKPRIRPSPAGQIGQELVSELVDVTTPRRDCWP